jgi:hypothetical protein
MLFSVIAANLVFFSLILSDILLSVTGLEGPDANRATILRIMNGFLAIYRRVDIFKSLR